MNDPHDRVYPVDQLSVSFPEFSELFGLVTEYPKDVLGGTTAFESFGKVVLGKVDSRLLGVIVQGIVKNQFESGGWRP